MAASGKTNLTTPIIILVVLVVAAWFAFKPSGDSAGTGEGGGTASGGDSALLVDVDRDAINRLDITKPDGDSFSLLKQDDSWFALIDGEQYLADDMRTSTLLDMLPELKQEAMMSTIRPSSSTMTRPTSYRCTPVAATRNSRCWSARAPRT